MATLALNVLMDKLLEKVTIAVSHHQIVLIVNLDVIDLNVINAKLMRQVVHAHRSLFLIPHPMLSAQMDKL
jgi:hypothetical protein